MSIWTLSRRNSLPVDPEEDAIYFIADPDDATLCDAFVSGDLGNVRKVKGVGGSAGATAWADVTGKPTFATVATTGAYADLSGLPTLGTAAAAATGDFAAASHTHTIANVTGLQTALDGKQASGSYATAAQGALADTAVQPAALASYQPISAVLTATTASYTTAEQSKLAGIAAGATANSADATLLARANHTGTQLAATISDFSTAADARVTAGITGKQDTLVSAINIKTINGTAVLGSGDLVIATPTAPATTTFNYTGAWQAYNIPAGATKLRITCIGPGGNGGAGFSRAAGNPGGGGGGGGAGGYTTLDVLVSRLNVSTIYAFPGSGSGGNVTYVSIAADTTPQNLLCRAVAGANATNGTAAAAGGAGAAGSISSFASTILASLGIANFIAGQIGGAGGAHTGQGGSSSTWGNTGIPLSGGGGGAGSTTTDFTGGRITGAGAVVVNSAGGTPGGGAGDNGTTYSGWNFYTGGAGGGSNNSGTGGRGGDGAIGCGGGGGGAGTTGGGGGFGGPGLVQITAFF